MLQRDKKNEQYARLSECAFIFLPFSFHISHDQKGFWMARMSKDLKGLSKSCVYRIADRQQANCQSHFAV